jgi:glyoxylase-like metal-dependent hydrolase (beta-lactamase superfamily II)
MGRPPAQSHRAPGRDTGLLLDELVPRYDLATTRTGLFHAPPHMCRRALGDLDLPRHPAIHRLLGLLAHQRAWTLLAGVTPVEIVYGPADRRGATSGFAFGLRMYPYGTQWSVLVMETRVTGGPRPVAALISRVLHGVVSRLLTAELRRSWIARRRPRQVAEGVYCLRTGRGITGSNVYFVRSGPAWVLIDTGRPHHGGVIRETAEWLFGTDTRPAAIVVTHLHPGHSGSAPELARAWNLPVLVPSGEMPMIAGRPLPGLMNPLDRWLLRPLGRVLPRGFPASGLAGVARSFDPGAGIAVLADWDCVPTPGHTPGHVAFFRSRDRVLIGGDAVLTVDTQSLTGLCRGRQRVSGPPRVSTWDWEGAKRSIATLAELEPAVLACGHGLPMTGVETAGALRAFADRLCGDRDNVIEFRGRQAR